VVCGDCGHTRYSHVGSLCLVGGCDCVSFAHDQPEPDPVLAVAQADIDVVAAMMAAVTMYGDSLRAAVPAGVEPIIRGLKLHLPDDTHPWPRLEMAHTAGAVGRSVWVEFTVNDETEEMF
jgi:hypothetical protein